MTSTVTRKKTAKSKRKVKSRVFHFCDLMCEGLEIRDNQKGEAPLPICLQDEKDDPALMYWNDSVLMYWNFWRCFVSALKKKLPKILTDEEITSTQGKILFSLFCEWETGSCLFSTCQELVAQRLGINPRISFFANNSTEAFKKLIFLCFADDKEILMDRELQKLTTINSSLDLPERCQLKLILASLADKPQSTKMIAPTNKK
ncbi:hypothetical protein KJ866_00605 [Patescibacteria group bacterium]|nr:hypothetical protein [Patescibacteria group bacterium]MBU2219652.1 hypothetical protein [Patescibacteria group bacterium]MBU2265333.1 hypothetical protein [Patescibacteria group bacterium]